MIMGLISGAGQTAVQSAKESGDMSAEQMEAAKAASEGVSALAGMGSAFFTVIFLVSLLLAGLSLFGVIKMWKMQKSGFYIYTAVNGLIFLFALISVEIWSIIITGGFIGMYAANFKHLE